MSYLPDSSMPAGGAYTFVSSAAAEAENYIQFTNLTSTYLWYLFMVDTVVLTTDGQVLRCQFSVSGTFSTANYDYVNYVSATTNGNAVTTSFPGGSQGSILLSQGIGNATGEGAQGTVTLYHHQQNAGLYPSTHSVISNLNGTAQAELVTGYGIDKGRSNTTIDGIRFFCGTAGSNTLTGTIYQYGMTSS